jgi:mycofactocin precursor
MTESTAVVTDTTETPEEIDVVEAELVEAELVEADLLVEDVSIDGMCGVY